MRKIFVLLLSVCLFVISGCSSQDLDGKAIYESALANMNKLDSIKMQMDMQLSIEAENEDDSDLSVTLPIKIVLIVTDMQSADQSGYVETSVSILGNSSTSKQWIKDGLVYIDENGTKSVAENTTDDVLIDLDSTDVSNDLEDIKATKVDDKYKIEAKLPFAAFKDMMSSSGAESVLEEMTSEEDIPITIIVNAENYIESMTMNTSIVMADVGTMVMDCEYTYDDYNEASLPEFDESEFLSDEMYESGYVYGEYDLTLDNAQDLMAMGYEDLGDYVYHNGEYYIDLEYKQIYTDSALIFYDWEYDQSFAYDSEMNPVCLYDFTFEELSQGDESSCDVESFIALRAAYNEIAKSILE